MKTKILKRQCSFISLTILLLFGCSKFLDEKPDAALSVPETLEDLDQLMHNESPINRSFPSLMESGSDDYYVKSNVLKSRNEAEQLVYSWTISLERTDLASWNSPYNAIMIANIVLEGLDRIKGGSVEERDRIRGEALFARAFAFYYLAQIFCLPYDAQNKSNDLGLPLRTSSDFAVTFERATMGETYDFIITDLSQAIRLLPEKARFKSWPSKAAANALMARLYLVMGNYKKSNEFATNALSYNKTLLDYNTINKELKIPFAVGHDEIIYYAFCSNGYLLAANRSFVPKELYFLYHEDDLRKELFFTVGGTGDILFKGNYDGVGGSYFAGMAIDELYLIRAECEIREGETERGLTFLNTLLRSRFKKGSYTEIKNLNGEQALDLVLLERRKELLRRGVRWTDLRRLAGGDSTIRYRKADDGEQNTEYKFELKKASYVYPIPEKILNMYPYRQNALN